MLKKQRIKDWLKGKHVGQAFQPAIKYPELREFTKKDWEAVFQYKRRLPHWEHEGATYFLTFHIARRLEGVNLLTITPENPKAENNMGVNNSRLSNQVSSITPASIVEESI